MHLSGQKVKEIHKHHHAVMNMLTLFYLVHVPNFGGCQGQRTGVGVTTVSNSLILGRWVTKVLKNGDEK